MPKLHFTFGIYSYSNFYLDFFFSINFLQIADKIRAPALNY